MVNSPETCGYRRLSRAEDGAEQACCALLQEITGLASGDLCRVRDEHCEGCCALPPPTTTELNAVTASLLFSLSREVIERGGVPGCDLGKAAGIERWAEQNLFVVKGEINQEPTVDLEELGRRGVFRECCYGGAPTGLRLEEPGNPRRVAPILECRHPAHAETTERRCYRCRDWTPQPRPASRPLADILPPPGRRFGRPVRRWAVGVTTAPRLESTLAISLDSLVRAGWEEPRLFMDSPVDVEPRHAHLPVSLRDTRIGAWPSYYLAMVELLMREPEADAYFLVQDDTVFYDRVDLREYLEEILWPDESVGAVSLYCPKLYTRPNDGWHELSESWLWGALAFIFPQEAAKRFVSDFDVVQQRWNNHHHGCANIDSTIGSWAQRSGLRIIYPTPSLTQHIGDYSTLWAHGRAAGAREASDFVEDREEAG